MPWVPQKSIWLKYKIGRTQLHDVIKILWKFYEIPLNGLRGFTDTRCVPPFDILTCMYCEVRIMPWEKTPKFNLIKLWNRRCTTTWWDEDSVRFVKFHQVVKEELWGRTNGRKYWRTPRSLYIYIYITTMRV